MKYPDLELIDSITAEVDTLDDICRDMDDLRSDIQYKLGLVNGYELEDHDVENFDWAVTDLERNRLQLQKLLNQFDVKLRKIQDMRYRLDD